MFQPFSHEIEGYLRRADEHDPSVKFNAVPSDIPCIVRMELFLALDLSAAGPGARTPDEDEAIEAVRLTIADAAEAVRRGAIVDAKSLVAIAVAERLASR